LPVLTPASLRQPSAHAAFAQHALDAAVVVAYGMILPEAILRAPRYGCYNLHASALPRWRGAAPIQRAIMAGDVETAATIMRMDSGLDTGPVCRERRLPIGPDMTAGELHDALAAIGADRSDLCGKNRQARGGDRFHASGDRGPQPDSRPLAGTGGVGGE
jgi:methionyl-tRNA formyltransferase